MGGTTGNSSRFVIPRTFKVPNNNMKHQRVVGNIDKEMKNLRTYVRKVDRFLFVVDTFHFWYVNSTDCEKPDTPDFAIFVRNTANYWWPISDHHWPHFRKLCIVAVADLGGATGSLISLGSEVAHSLRL